MLFEALIFYEFCFRKIKKSLNKIEFKYYRLHLYPEIVK